MKTDHIPKYHEVSTRKHSLGGSWMYLTKLAGVVEPVKLFLVGRNYITRTPFHAWLVFITHCHRLLRILGFQNHVVPYHATVQFYSCS